MMKIRKATIKDLDGIMEVIEEARGTIASLGIDQWQDGYPQREIIEADINNGVSFCIENTDTGEVVSTFAVFSDGEVLYDRIFDGAWRTGDSLSNKKDDVCYTAIHRVAISVKARGNGLSSEIINFVMNIAIEKGKKSLRIDTHEGNVVMRRMLEKNGFVHCGTIFLENGESRVAYEKLI